MPNVSLDDLTPNARDLAEQSLTWSERRWDPEGALLGSKIVGTPGESRLGVRNSVWTAVGFLLRNADGDTKRASRTIDAIIEAAPIDARSTRPRMHGMSMAGTRCMFSAKYDAESITRICWAARSGACPSARALALTPSVV